MKTALETHTSPKPAASLTRHLVRYGSASVLGILAGVISYPILTRTLNQTQIGLLAYFDTFALIWTALLKMGTQNSIQRFYPVYGISADPARRRAYFASLIQAPALISIVLCAVALALLPAINRIYPISHLRFLVIVLVLGELRVLASLVDNLIRAREHSKLASRLGIAARWVQTALVIAVITLVSKTAMAVYLAQLAVALGLLVFYFHWSRREFEGGVGAFSPAIFREGLAYGLPLVWSEISFILLAFADRTMMIPLGCSWDEVGIYAVGYGLAMIAGDFVTYSLLPAFQPMANRIYETEGREAVLELQRRVLRGLYYVAAAVAVGLIFVGRDFLILCAGAKNAAAAPVFQWIGVNYIILPIFGVMAYGLNLKKRTRVIAAIVLVAAAINIALNLVMIPRFKVMGAVWATLACYVVLGVAQIACCPRDHLPTPRRGDLLRPLGLAGAMALVAWASGLFGAQSHLGRLCAMAGIFVLTYLIPLIAIDRSIRGKMIQYLK